MKRQRTIKKAVTISGTGLHSGNRVTLKMLPAKANTGIRFLRTDIENAKPIRAYVHNVSSTTLATTLGEGTNKISTVEHLLSALYGLGIDNILCEVNSEEVPILDGSAFPYVELLQKAGIKRLATAKTFLVIKETIEIREKDKWAILRPGKEFRIQYSIDFKHPAIGSQAYTYTSETDFAKEIAKCRTFGFLQDVERLQKMGLALGGSLENAVVLDDERVLNPEGLRFKDEFVRHKILDALGDLSLVGHQIMGEVELHRAGHELQTRLIQELLNRPSAYSLYTPASEVAEEEIVVGASVYA